MTSHAELLQKAALALRSITDGIDEAVNQKIRTGRMPPIGALLSEIQDTARAALDEISAADQLNEG